MDQDIANEFIGFNQCLHDIIDELRNIQIQLADNQLTKRETFVKAEFRDIVRSMIASGVNWQSMMSDITLVTFGPDGPERDQAKVNIRCGMVQEDEFLIIVSSAYNGLMEAFVAISQEGE